mgnify:FL=1
MRLLLITIVCTLFVAMLAVNLYFRAKVLRSYRVLVQNEVDFTPGQIFSKLRVEDEIIPRYPNSAEAIRNFSNYLQLSIKMTTVLMTLITAFGGILMWFRHEI